MFQFRHAACVALVSGSALVSALSFIPSCQKSPEKAQSEALEAERRAELTQVIIPGPADSRLLEERTEAQKKAAVATDTLREARDDIAKKGDEKLMKLEQRISVLRGRLSTSTKQGTARSELERKIDDAVTQLTRSRATLDNAAKANDALGLAAESARFESEVKALDSVLSRLAKEI